MELLPVRRKCLLRFREQSLPEAVHTDKRCAGSKTLSHRFTLEQQRPADHQPANHRVYTEPLPPPSRRKCLFSRPFTGCKKKTSRTQIPAGPAGPRDQQAPETRAEDFMDVDDDIDPETGERAQQ